MNATTLLSVGAPLRVEFPEYFQNIVELLSQPLDNIDAVYSAIQALFSTPPGDGEYLLSHPEQLLALHELSAVHNGALFATISIHYNLSIGTIRALGNDSAYVNSFYNDLVQGRAIGVYLATELAHGNNVVALQTEAEYLPHTQSFKLHTPNKDAYKFMPNTLPTRLPKIAVVMARLRIRKEEYGVVPFLVPLHKDGKVLSGISVSPLGEKAGLLLDNAMTGFHNLELPFDALLSRDILTLEENGNVVFHEKKSRDRFLLSMNRVQSGKLCMAAGCLGMSKSALHITHTYGAQRETFSIKGVVHLTDYRSFIQPIVSGTAEVTVLSLWVSELNNRLHSDTALSINLPEGIKNEIALAKSLTSWSARDIVVRCRELCGAQGIFSVNRFPEYYATINGCITAEGDNVVIMYKAARDYLQQPLEFSLNLDNCVYAALIDNLQKHCLTLHRSLQELLSTKDSSEHFKRWNQESENILEMIQIIGVLTCVTSVIPQSANNPIIELSIELFLLEWQEKISLSLLASNSIDQERIIEQRKRKRQIMEKYGDDILELINAFAIDQVNLKTPISENNYIHWFAQHHENCSSSVK